MTTSEVSVAALFRLDLFKEGQAGIKETSWRLH